MGSVTAFEQVASDDMLSKVESLTLKLANGTTPRAILQAPLPNPSLQVTADHQLKSIDAPVFAPKAGEVLLHIKATGVCG